MKRIAILLLVLLAPALSYAGDAVINKEKCTITKDGKTFPLYGKVYVTDRGDADMRVYITDRGDADIRVYIADRGDAGIR